MSEESPEETPPVAEQRGVMISVLIVVLLALVAYFVLHALRGAG
ncbi:MAG: hypothetical protein ACREOJ_07260 [Gemmatimonadaceae bacterium]